MVRGQNPIRTAVCYLLPTEVGVAGFQACGTIKPEIVHRKLYGAGKGTRTPTSWTQEPKSCASTNSDHTGRLKSVAGACLEVRSSRDNTPATKTVLGERL